ncbi:hypothetical protein B0H19DRAFT_1071437 [Mycena capillaripes]|nr:hypothetical protein B0H19DRAFT_1071437 [Mycena capillaripes]
MSMNMKVLWGVRACTVWREMGMTWRRKNGYKNPDSEQEAGGMESIDTSAKRALKVGRSFWPRYKGMGGETAAAEAPSITREQLGRNRPKFDVKTRINGEDGWRATFERDSLEGVTVQEGVSVFPLSDEARIDERGNEEEKELAFGSERSGSIANA